MLVINYVIMPRLTNLDYVRIHHYLRDHWVRDPMPYSLLTPDDQWDLHAYFQPYVAWDDVGLVDYRKHISVERRSLPQCAGRALRRFEDAVERLPQMRAWVKEHPKKYQSAQSFTIYPLMKPEMDTRKIARALIAYAEWEIREEDKK